MSKCLRWLDTGGTMVVKLDVYRGDTLMFVKDYN